MRSPSTTVVRRLGCVTALVLLAAPLAVPATAITVDEILATYVKSVGGLKSIQSVHSLRRTGRSIRGGGFELPIVQENERPNRVREEVIRQGLTGIHAWDGSSGWKITPWQGKKDAESLSEEETKGMIDDADFDGPLIDPRAKGIRIEYVGPDDVEGTAVHELRVTHKNGDVDLYYLDVETCVPIKIESKRMVRGTEQETVTMLGDYKAVSGWYLPHALELAEKGSPFSRQIVYDSIQANAPMDEARFRRPAAPSQP